MLLRRILPFAIIASLVVACTSSPDTPATAEPATRLTSAPTTQATLPTAQAPAATAVDRTQQPTTTSAGVTTTATPDSATSPTEGPAIPAVPTNVPPLFARITIPPIATELPPGFRSANTGGFASFQLPDVVTSASLASVTAPADLAGVSVPIVLSPQQRDFIARQGFVVSPSDSSKFFEVYERNRYDFLPSFITTDSILHGYHQAFDGVLRQTEMTSFAPTLVQLDHAMLAMSANYYERLAGTAWEEAARRNTAYFAVAVALLEPDWKVPQQIADLVLPELDYVRAHDGPHQSPLFPDDPRGEDYSQYTPRGHYTRNETLSRYFQAMMWHGRRSFTAADYTTSARDGLVIVQRQEVLMVQALREAKTQQATSLDMWNAIYEPTSFFVGETDGLTPRDIFPVLEQVYGQVTDIRQIADDAKLAQVEAALKTRRAEVIQDRAKGPGRFELPLISGLRFMGARLVPDAEIFSKLVAPAVDDRLAPKALDVFAALGSDQALKHLETAGDTKFKGYTTNMASLRQQFATLDDQTWSSTVYFGWLNTLRPLLETSASGYPSFMRSTAWQDKQLHTALGSWAELKHDTLLYAKQLAVEAGFALEPPEPDLPRGYVEPAPLVYARIVGLSKMTKQGLSDRGLLSETSANVLDQVISIAKQLQTLAEKELRGEALSEEEARWIFQYGIALENLARNAETDPDFGGGESGEPPQSAIVADIATSFEGIVHVGNGKVFHILVAVPVDGKITVMRGGVYSFYEFTEPTRLTDEEWRAQLDRGEAPERPEWTSSFEVDETQASLLTERILAFNDAVTAAFWHRNPDSISHTRTEGVKDFVVGAELEDTLDYIKQLESQNQFLGMKRLAFDFRSFDISGDTGTVTTREQWDERFYSGSSSDYFEVPTPVRQRVYTADVTYSLALQDGKWMITKIAVQEQK